MLAPYRSTRARTSVPTGARHGARGSTRPAATRSPACRASIRQAGRSTHAIGDRATRELSTTSRPRALERRKGPAPHDYAPAGIDAADIPRFAALGVVASMSLQWARRDGYSVDNTEGYIEDALYERLFPAAELWRKGALIAGGSDYPVDPLLPMVQIETAIDHTGEAVPGVYAGALSPGQVVPDSRPIRCTRSTAPGDLSERNVGLIEVGKYADLIALSQTPSRCRPSGLRDQVVQTILGGKPFTASTAPLPGRYELTRASRLLRRHPWWHSHRLLHRAVDTPVPLPTISPFVDRPSAQQTAAVKIRQWAAAGRPGRRLIGSDPMSTVNQLIAATLSPARRARYRRSAARRRSAACARASTRRHRRSRTRRCARSPRCA
jgi:hypothetical protein